MLFSAEWLPHFKRVEIGFALSFDCDFVLILIIPNESNRVVKNRITINALESWPDSAMIFKRYIDAVSK